MNCPKLVKVGKGGSFLIAGGQIHEVGYGGGGFPYWPSVYKLVGFGTKPQPKANFLQFMDLQQPSLTPSTTVFNSWVTSAHRADELYREPGIIRLH